MTSSISSTSSKRDSTEHTNSGSSNQYSESWDSAHSIGYDLAGRQVTDLAQTCSVTASTDPSPVFQVHQAPQLTSRRTYDADNHLIAQTLPAGYEPTGNDCSQVLGNPSYPYAISVSYTWGPDSHLAQMGVVNNGVSSSSTVGWDGDDVLYNAQGAQLGIAD